VNSLTTLLSRSRAIIAFALIAWCAGAGCLAVSLAQEKAGAAATPVKANVFGGITASAGTGSSCHQHGAKKILRHAQTKPSDITLSDMPNSPGASSCCPLMRASFVTTTSNHSNQEQIAAATRTLLPHFQSISAPQTVAPPLLLRNHDQTYLQVCSLLI